MNEDGQDLLNKTWNRAIEPIHKIGFMDGAADGQTAVFQSSFDMGYAQGLDFGVQLGFQKGNSIASKINKPQILTDTREINCQICISNRAQENVGNLYNIQQEKNMSIIKEYVNNT